MGNMVTTMAAILMPMEKVSHEEFKALLPKVRTVVRTGETSSYCNVILRAGVNF